MTPARDVYGEAFGDGYAKGFTAGTEHAREQAATQLEARANVLSWEVGTRLADKELREQAAKIRSGR